MTCETAKKMVFNADVVLVSTEATTEYVRCPLELTLMVLFISVVSILEGAPMARFY